MSSMSTASQHESRPSFVQQPWFQKCRPFLVGGCSGLVATTCIQPIDMVKVRLQLYGEGARGVPKSSALAVARDIIAKGSFFNLYDGLSAGYLRQLVYGTARLGFFFTFEDALKRRARRHETDYGFGQRALAGLSAGGLGAFIGNPVEVALIRMQSDGLRPKAERVNYRSVFHALADIARGEGIKGLWSGSYPTIIRAMATNFGQLAFFSESKHQLAKRTAFSEQMCSVLASGVAGFAASFFSLPFDFIKTRLQRQSKTNAIRYNSVLDLIKKVVRQDGVLRFYRGFTTYFFRIAPHTIITLIIADYANGSLKT